MLQETLSYLVSTFACLNLLPSRFKLKRHFPKAQGQTTQHHVSQTLMISHTTYSLSAHHFPSSNTTRRVLAATFSVDVAQVTTGWCAK